MRDRLWRVQVMLVGCWWGAALWMTVGIGPTLFSPAVGEIVPRPTVGRVAEVLLRHYFVGQAVVAGVLLALAWMVARRDPKRLSWIAVAGLAAACAVGVLGRSLVGPQMERWHAVRYDPTQPAEIRAAAARKFGRMHGISSGINLLILVGVGGYLWRLTGTGVSKGLLTTVSDGDK